MIFNSLEFALFLPIFFVIYWLLKGSLKVQNLFVVAASYIFYGWWDWRFLILIAFTSFCSYYSGILIEYVRLKDENKEEFSPRLSRTITVVNIVINLLILGLFKYYNFFVDSFCSLIPSLREDELLLHLILPVGISFYTFQALSYSIDVYKKKIEPTHDLIAFLAFVSFFPQLVAGPIERATNLLPQFTKQRRFDYAEAVIGMRLILWGLFKKMIIADRCAWYVDDVWADYGNQSASSLALAAILFSFQIYGDFSGYSDVAIGTSKLFGIRLMRNFNVPYFSRDIAEFWRRWHISLTTWFRDYIYIPLGGSRVSKIKVVRNTFVIFLVSGLWHGANWTYVIWGAFHALLFLPMILLGKNRKHIEVVASYSLLPSAKELVQIFATFLLVCLGWIIFRAPSIGDALMFIKGLFSISLFTLPEIIPFVTLLLVFMMLVIEWISRKSSYEFDISWIKKRWIRWCLYYIIIFIIFFYAVESKPFIYFQF